MIWPVRVVVGISGGAHARGRDRPRCPGAGTRAGHPLPRSSRHGRRYRQRLLPHRRHDRRALLDARPTVTLIVRMAPATGRSCDNSTSTCRGVWTVSSGLCFFCFPEVGGSGYFRQRVVAPHIAAGRLHLVTGAPGFFYPIYAVRSAQADDELMALALAGLRNVAAADPVDLE